jgi:hypothetical protein
MANTTNYNWETPDDTDLVKDGAAAIRTLGNSIDTTTKNLNPETTTGDIAYRSATANTNTRLAIGSAGQVLTVAAGVPSWATPTDQTPLTTKGDVFTFSTVDARLGVGANGTVLTADSAETTGLKWAAPSSGGLTLISETVASANSSVSFSSIPATYDQLLMIVTGLVIDGSSTAQQTFSLKVNSLDSIYVNQRTTVDDTGTSVRFATDTHLEFFNAVTTTTLENSVNGYILIDNYASTTKVKNFCFARAAQDRQSNILRTQSWQGFFNTTAAIDTVAIVRQVGTANLSNLTNTSVRLYGVS